MKLMLFALAPLLAVLSAAGQEIDYTSTVVSIEMKMIEAPRADLNRLIPNRTYVVPAELLQKIQEMIDHGKAVILAQPRLATISGAQAQVKAVRELIYPSEYDLRHSPVNVYRTNVTAQITPQGPGTLFPTSFKTREVGTILNITPIVGQDHQTMNLALTPEVSLLSKLGFLKHQADSPLGKTEFSQPDIYCWSEQTSILIWSGTTVVVGMLDPISGREPDATHENAVLMLLTASVSPIVPTPSHKN